jgi:hypothetical protein
VAVQDLPRQREMDIRIVERIDHAAGEMHLHDQQDRR